MATGPTQSAPMPSSKRGIIDGELIAFEDETVNGSDVNSAWFDLGPGLFVGSLVVEVTSSAASIEFRGALANDTAGTDPESCEKFAIQSGETGRYEMQFSNQAKDGDDIISKRAVRFTAAPGATGDVVVRIAYIAKAKS